MERQQEGFEWHAILEEAEDLAGLQKWKQNSFNASEIFEPRRSQQGARCRSRFKFSFQQFPRDDDLLCVYSLKDGAYNSCEEDIEMPADGDIFEHRASENIETQFCEDVVEESAEVNSRLGFHEQRSEAPSLSELLENLQKANNPSDRRNWVASKSGDDTKGKARQMRSSKRTPLHLGDRVLGIEDPFDFKGADSFADDRHIDQVSQTNQFDKGKTILDNSKGKARSKRTQLPLGDRVLGIEDPHEFISSDSYDDDQYTNQGCQTNQFNKAQAMLDSTKGKAKQVCSSKQTELHLGNRVLGIEDPLMFIGADSSGNDKYIDQGSQTNQFDKEKAILTDGKGKARSKRTKLPLVDRVCDIEDPLEFIGANSSGKDKHTEQDCQAGQFDKGQTMLDLFQDAFDTATEERAAFLPSNQFGFGYHGRLQEVMQLEKDRDVEYMQQLQTGRRPSNESQCIHVRILSRVLEAKLTVCQCLFGENSNNLELEQRNPKGCYESSNDGGTMKKTIIFCPRICSSMELEIGSLVRVHPPWKEVQVNGGETIILCRHFSRLVR